MRSEGAEKKLFVGGLNYETDDKTLKQYFERFGPLSDYVVMRFPDSEKRSRGFGFITFERVGDMENCFGMQPHTIDGRTVELKRATPREDIGGRGGGSGGRKHDDDEPIDPEGKLMRKLFIGGLSYNTTEEGMREYFEKYGSIEDAVIMKFPDSGRSRGFGFITFEKSYMVDDCQRDRPHAIDGKDIECKRATPKSDARKPEAQASVKKLYVGNLNEDISDSDLSDYFAKFGKVTNVEQMKWNDTGKKRGFGFIEFDDYDAVDKICLLGRHYLLGKKLEVRKALSKQEMSIIKKAKMNEEYSKGNNSGGAGGQMGMHMGDMGGGMSSMGMGNMGNMGNMGGGMGMGNMGGGMNQMNQMMQMMNQMNQSGNQGMGNMNPMMMMQMMMNMMSGGNMMGMMNNGSNSGNGNSGQKYQAETTGIKKESKERGFGNVTPSQQSYGAGGYSSTGYGSGTQGQSSVYGTSGYSSAGGYGDSNAAAAGGTGMDMMSNMSNMANMMGMNWGAGNMGSSWGQQGDSTRSSGGGPMRGSMNRESTAPYSRR